MIAALLNWGLADSAALAQGGVPNLSFPVTLDQGPDAGQIREMTFEVITSAQGLEALWERLHGGAAAPSIDFGTFQLVGAFAGQSPYGSYEVKLLRAQLDTQAIELEFEVDAATAYADAVPTMLMGSPYMLILVPANRPVTTRWRFP